MKPGNHRAPGTVASPPCRPDAARRGGIGRIVVCAARPAGSRPRTVLRTLLVIHGVAAFASAVAFGSVLIARGASLSAAAQPRYGAGRSGIDGSCLSAGLCCSTTEVKRPGRPAAPSHRRIRRPRRRRVARCPGAGGRAVGGSERLSPRERARVPRFCGSLVIPQFMENGDPTSLQMATTSMSKS